MRKIVRIFVMVGMVVTLSLCMGAPDNSKPVTIKAKPTQEEWQAKKASKNKDKDDYFKKKQAYLDNPTPGKLNAMNVARAKYQDSAKESRRTRESLKRNQ